MGRANDIHQDFIKGTSSLLTKKDLKSSIIEQTHNEQSTFFENLMKITQFFYQEHIKQIEFKTNLKQDLLELQDDNRRFLQESEEIEDILKRQQLQNEQVTLELREKETEVQELMS